MKNEYLTRDDLIVKISKCKYNVYTFAELATLSFSELEELFELLVNKEVSESGADAELINNDEEDGVGTRV